MNNPYDTLGLPPNIDRAALSADEIHDAYRRAAMHAHPDRKGGSAEKMADVNEAFDLLRDAQRRAAFDAEGKTEQEKPKEEKAEQLLMLAFARALESPEVLPLLEATRTVVDFEMTEISNRGKRLRKMKQDMLKRSASIQKTDDIRNALQMVVDQNLKAIDNDLKNCDDLYLDWMAAGALLQGYEERRGEMVRVELAFNTIRIGL